MKTVIIHGQNHKGSTYHVGHILAEKLADKNEIREFFLPRDLNGFCAGCFACVDDETKCPHYKEKDVIAEAMEEAELLIFTTPTYCMECSAPMKALIDLFYQYWIPHRPRASMFKKKAAVISTAAGIGTGKAIAPVKRNLEYWGVPFIRTYGTAVQASGWDEVTESKKQKIEADIDALARKIKKGKVRKPKLFMRFMFTVMGAAKKDSKPSSYDYNEALYWKENGWLSGKKPWKNG